MNSVERVRTALKLGQSDRVPVLVELTMEKVLRCNMRIVQRAIQAGAEVIILGDEYL